MILVYCESTYRLFLVSSMYIIPSSWSPLLEELSGVVVSFLAMQTIPQVNTSATLGCRKKLPPKHVKAIHNDVPVYVRHELREQQKTAELTSRM